MYLEICSCTWLHYTDLWEYKKTIRSPKVHTKLRLLANPLCKKCKGDGKYKV